MRVAPIPTLWMANRLFRKPRLTSLHRLYSHCWQLIGCAKRSVQPISCQQCELTASEWKLTKHAASFKHRRRGKQRWNGAHMPTDGRRSLKKKKTFNHRGQCGAEWRGERSRGGGVGGERGLTYILGIIAPSPPPFITLHPVLSERGVGNLKPHTSKLWFTMLLKYGFLSHSSKMKHSICFVVVVVFTYKYIHLTDAGAR